MHTPLRYAILALGVTLGFNAAAANLHHRAIDALLNPLTHPDRPGCAVGVMQNGRLDYQKAYGLANLEHGIPIDPVGTVFNIASMSKQFTAAAVLLLEQEGKLSLDDDVRRHLPELPDFGHKITIKQLLHHTSGLRDYAGMMMIGERNPADYTDNKAIMDFLQRQRGLDFVPGSEYGYSNTGYFLLARIIEKVSGKDYPTFVRGRLFEPLAMRNSTVPAELGSLLPHRASGYVPAGPDSYMTALSGWTENGARGVYTTLADLARWDANFAAPKVGGKAFIANLLEPGRLDEGTRIDYAGGLHIGMYRGAAMIEHGGADQGFRSEMLRFPDKGISVAVLCNDMGADPEGLAYKVADIYLEGKLGPAKAGEAQQANAPLQPNADQLAGSYWSRERGLVRQVRWERGQLWYVRSSRSRSALVPVGPGRFRLDMPGSKTELVFFQSDEGLHLRMLSPFDKAIEFEAVKPPASIPATDYAGSFVSKEYETRWLISVKDGGINVRGWRDPDEDARPMTPLSADAFSDGGQVVRFVRDGAGHVVELRVDTSRSRNIVFEKAPDR
jgi:CubicO group peptidase (beta-lactamase class C family)